MRRLTKLLIPLAIFIFIPLCVNAKFYFNFDYAQFKGSKGKTKLEVYSSFLQKNLKYSDQSGKYSGNALLEVSFYDLAKNNFIFDQTYNIPVNLTDTSKAKLNENLLVKLDFNIPPGNYRLTGIGADGNERSNIDSISYDIIVSDFESTAAMLSDIQFSSSISNSKDTSSMFYKNTLEVLPNPNNLFGNNLKQIFYYIELYNLNSASTSGDLNVDIHISDINLKEKYTASKTLKKGSDSRVDIGKFSIDSFPSGTYTLKYNLMVNGGTAVARERKFYVYNPGITTNSFKDDNNDYLKSEFGSMTSENADKEFEKLMYIISPKEKDYYNKLSSTEDKRKFLFSFWKARNNSPTTNLRINFFKRIAEANNLFGESYKDGWKTDRGRMYVVYGPPDLRDKYPFESENKAYEVWQWYNVEGGTEADFVERESSTGIYSLVNTTLKKEVSFPEWRTFYHISYNPSGTIKPKN